MNNAMLPALRARLAVVTYAYTLTFRREFTSGNLVGLTHDDKLGFCSLFDAEEWVSGVNRAHAAGKVDYKVISWTVGRAA